MHTCIYKLQLERNIVIKLTGKGSATVIWDKNDYIRKCTE